MISYYPLLAFASLAAAAPAAPEVQQNCKPHTICVDKISPCGVRYGGCYDVCKTADAPIAPLCAPTSTPVISWTTVTVPASTTARTICVDYINKCGQMYGGCFASTSPWPTFTAPSCSLETTTTTPPLTTVMPTTTAVPTICVDYINKCGQTYGGCFPSTTPFPTFTGPSCSLETTTTAHPVTTSTPLTTTVPTICVDSINSCGKTYGGCFASTRPFPTFSDPGCP
ncbi:hypothetical protein CONLIGDRAFT_627368 [Coniochaeta ligniaria NRRL 30616]|uniref:Uncharacterized protein n=1 Tax=Coniochaeta ligniaria NRRL 30616 TaxID=1408157 RepID=A0A1J7J7H1_9PEZI|nr:hypothetical protein CONLIGDRAFT_627368 [Coniochaeta ligniaria NRRL 30616]